MNYLALGKQLEKEKYVFCKYRVVTDLPLEKAANEIAAEESTGTWTATSTLTDEIFAKLGAQVIGIEKVAEGEGLIDIAYPNEDFCQVGDIPQILSVIAGNLFGLEELKGVRLEDVQFSKEVVSWFKGPKFGIEGVRKLIKHPKGKPFIGTIVKPKIGLSPKDTAKYVYEAGMGGLTNSKDDETLVDQKFCPLEDRVRLIAEAIDKVKDETGHRMLHATNVSTRADKIVEVAERALKAGANQLMVDVITTSYAGIQALAEEKSIKVPIHVHRTTHAALTRNPKHGISMTVIAKLSRLSGGDGLHVGTFGVGKMHGKPEKDREAQLALIDKWHDMKAVIPVCSGGMHPRLVEPLIKIAGPDIQIQAGGGVSGHPMGVRGGAAAMVQAVDAALAGIHVDEYAKTHKELELAIKKW